MDTERDHAAVKTHLLASHILRADPDHIPRALEEVPRTQSPFTQMTRVATEDVQLGGHEIAANRPFSVWLASANRDEWRFREAADFDPDRNPNPHLAFGRGIHFCLNAPLARLDGRVALDALLQRFTTISTITDDPPPQHRTDRTAQATPALLITTPSQRKIRDGDGRHGEVSLGGRLAWEPERLAR